MRNWLSLGGARLLTAAANDFVWAENLGKVIGTALLSMVPTYEGRYAVPVMLKLGMPPLFTYLLAAVCSTIPMPFILLLLRPVLTNPLMLGVAVCIVGMPIASNFTMLSSQYDRDQSLAAAATFITTLLSMFTIPVLAGVLMA